MSLLWKTATEQAEPLYHGTIHRFEPGDHILPTSQHGGRAVFPHVSNPEHAYATPKHDDAWHYAEMAWNGASMHHPDLDGPPRVYHVEPLGHVEKDPTETLPDGSRWRDPFENDKRSTDGFRVVKEMPMPEHMGDPDDWR